MIRIRMPHKKLDASIHLPASKSISNRLLILQFGYGAELKISNLSRSDDTILLSSLLDVIRQNQLKGEQGILRLDAHNAGTAYRFLAALLSITRGHYLLTGDHRMKKRPVGPLVEALKMIGADIEYSEKIGYPPLLIKGHYLEGGDVTLDASLSSQFLSALLLIAPMLENGMIINLTRYKSSWPYAEMTCKLLSDLGIKLIIEDKRIKIGYKEVLKKEMEVEKDWSSASFWFSILSMAGKGELRFPGLSLTGLQGDEKVVDFFSHLGISADNESEEIRIIKGQGEKTTCLMDFSDYPDLAIPVILSFAVAGIHNEYKGLERLRLKESDRLEGLFREMGKTGISLVPKQNGLWTTEGDFSPVGEILVHHEDDHRMAMAFAALAMKGCNVLIESPEVVNKSYPGFWNDLESAGFKVEVSC